MTYDRYLIRHIRKLEKRLRKLKGVDNNMGSKVAWTGLGLIFGLAPFVPVVLVAGQIILVIGVVLIILDK